MAILKTFLAIGIAILFAVFIGYGVYILYEPPRYEYEMSNCSLEHNCDAAMNECWNTATANNTLPAPPNKDCWQEISRTPEYQRCMQAQQECEDQWRKTAERYGHMRNSFFILIVIGIIAILAGMRLNTLEGIGSGLVGGGVLIVLWSLPYTSEYWITWNKWVKWLAVGLVLVILIYTGYKRVEMRFAKKAKPSPKAAKKRRKK